MFVFLSKKLKNLEEKVVRNKYNKWLVIEAEQDPDKANPYIYAKKGYSYLKSVIDDIGYII